jgi:Ca2+-binding EF-hand superfamily protein
MLSDIQTRKFSRLFSVLDHDKSGALEAADLERLGRSLAEGRGFRPGDERYAAVAARYSAFWQTLAPFARDGKVSRDAFLAFHDGILAAAGAYDGTIKALATFIFEALDADGDGRITLAEHKAFYKAYGIPEALADEIFPKLDVDHDGHLTRGEVSDLVTQFFFSSAAESPGNLLFGGF